MLIPDQLGKRSMFPHLHTFQEMVFYMNQGQLHQTLQGSIVLPQQRCQDMCSSVAHLDVAQVETCSIQVIYNEINKTVWK